MNRLLNIFAICLCQLVLFAQAGRAAEIYSTTYWVEYGESHEAGETVNKDFVVLAEDGSSSEGTVATLTFGVAGEAEFSSAIWGNYFNGFEAYLEGNGVDGNNDNGNPSGTIYIIQPQYNGYIGVAVRQEAGTPLYIQEDDKSMEGFDGMTVNSRYDGLYYFKVKSGGTYKVFAKGAKLGFYGFSYIYTTDATATLDMHELKLNVTPSAAGSLYPNTSQMVATGQEIYIETYSHNSNYKFKYWKDQNGEIISETGWLTYTMPNEDVELTAVYEFSPVSPGNPESAEDTYKLTLQSVPTNAGYFNGGNEKKVKAGETVYLYAYVNNSNYKFREWQVNGERIGTERELQYTMPAENTIVTAIYDFSPVSPGNPGANSYDVQSGIVILDDFQPGNASNALYNVTNGNYENVLTLIMAGTINQYDPGIVRNCSNCTELDLSRTTGINYLRNWLFENCTSLTTISVPACIEKINNAVFSGCENLATLNIFSVTPPVVTNGAFLNLNPENVTVHVPYESVSLYQEAEVWKNFNIQPLSSQVCNLEVDFSEDVDMSLYKDMYIELYNLTSGQRQRYVITNSKVYTFSSLLKNTTYEVTLKDAKDRVFGKIENIEIVDKDVKKDFGTLTAPKDVTLSVTAGNTDVTGQVTITWTDTEGNFLAQGATLKNLLKDEVVKYRVSLSEALAMQYQQPAEVEYTVTEGENTPAMALAAIPEVTLSGKVTFFNPYKVALSGAIVSISQTLNGQYTKTFAAKTGDDGQWTVKAFLAPSEITASKTGFVSQTQALSVDDLGATVVVPDFELKSINGTSVFFTLNYQPIDGNSTAYADVNNVAFTLAKEDGEEITGFSVQVQDSKLVLQESLPENTVLKVTVSSKNQKFMPVTTTASVNANNIVNVGTITIKQLGGIFATYGATDNQSCVGILYDANGFFVSRYDYADTQLTINELTDGSYTLVTMGNSQLFNSVGQLSQFTESGMREGMDYMKNTVTVNSGELAVIKNQRIPFLDETKLYYTGDNTSFSMNKSQVTAGQYVTLRGQVDFKDAYAGAVSDVTLVFDLTESGKFVDNSVMLGKQLTDYTVKGNLIYVPIGNSTEQVRFCVIPTKEGTFEPSASVSFTYNNKSILQPIGSASAIVKGATLTVPAVIAQETFTASGTAIAKSEVYVYADDVLVGKTTAFASGKWAVECTLTLADKNAVSSHLVTARIVTPEKAELLSETKTVTYDPNAILAQSVGMSFYNGWLRGTQSVSWDMITKKAKPTSYMFYTTTDITFLIGFTANDPAKVKDVQLVVFKNNNKQDILNAVYNDKKKCWVASNSYSSNALPVCVKVKYVINGVQQCVTKDYDDEGIEHVNPILDPSGYVYEAVSSNRLQGVTASIYYKEIRYDAYGDPYEVEGLWNAEEYAQQNPLFTDENGMYAWDVPSGTWQVRLAKEGYLDTKSEWLPVPPPQLDVNLPMVQMKQPNVQSTKTSAKGVEIVFDKYMDPATLTTENITVTRGGENVPGSIELLNEEPVTEGAAQTYASKIFFKVEEGNDLQPSDEIQLIVNKNVMSYAGVSMQENYTQGQNVEPVVTTITTNDELVNVPYGGNRTVKVAALPADAAKGKKLTITSLSELVSVDQTEISLDGKGEASFNVTGDLLGSTVLMFTVEESDAEGQLTVNVKNEADLKVVAPMASRVSGTEVYRNSKIQLSSETKNAVIYYTLDGSSPVDNENALVYSDDAPIVITADNVTIKAYAKGQDLENSDVKEFTYSLKKTTVGFDMNAGWTWISHNLEDAISVSELQAVPGVEAVLGQRSETIKDPVYGFFGSLTELKSTEGYKIRLSQKANKFLKNGYEFNAAANTISVNSGWNWISYPLSLQMRVSEALEFCQPTVGDMVVGQEGYAEYTNDGWKGTLERMTPGFGYLYKSATAAELTFNTIYVSDAPSQVGKRNLLMGSPWAYDIHAYPSVMPVTAELKDAAGMSLTDADAMMVGAFVDTECRGIGQWKNGRLMISVHGDKDDKVHFIAYNKDTEESFDISETFDFKSDNMGTWNAPTLLTLGGAATGINTLNGDLSVTPLVANDHLTISAGGRQISRLTLTNVGGQTVLTVNDLGTEGVVTLGTLPDGLYIVTVQADGNTYYQKIRKANK